jgi:8-oxo-dGTP pyrophosphatase MutT (NUDIX family)
MPPQEPPASPPVRRGAVGVVVEQGKFLVIRRAPHISAGGKICFPGGGIEPGEAEEAALVRELWEELRVRVRPVRRLWESVTPWNVHLAWWSAVRVDAVPLDPQPDEVSEYRWLDAAELVAEADLLASNRDFLAAVESGEITLD